MSASPLSVVKVGGALLTQPGAIDAAARALDAAAARGERILAVPGGGPLADTVRRLDASLQLDPSTTHWMAVLAMDQHALLLASRTAGGRVTDDPARVSAILDAHTVPVLAPYRWLRERDPLPHSWDVTSDSIAAWVAGEVGAQRLVLVKPVTGDRAALVDPYFERALPAGVRVVIADVATLTEALRAT